MSAVVLRFVGGSDIASELIEYFGGDLGLSHVDAVMPDGLGLLGARSDNVGGVGPGVWIRPLNYLPYKTVRDVSISCSQEQQDRFYDALLSQISKPYSKITILGLIVGHDFHDKNGWICDELVAWACCQAGVLPPELLPLMSELTPNSLWAAAVSAAYCRAAA